MGKRVVIIGGGAGGMMAAISAADAGARVVLLEKMARMGEKVRITGKTRCNLTNARPLAEFIPMFGPNGRFLYGAFAEFFRDELLAFLDAAGVATKTERGGRIFPVSDAADDVVAAFEQALRRRGVTIRTGVRATAIRTADGRVAGVETDGGMIPADAVILAAGGSSWPATGSTGDGVRLAQALGHRIVPLRPALVPLLVEEVELAKSMQGVSLKNVRLAAFALPPGAVTPRIMPAADAGRGIGGKRPKAPLIENRFGEMLFTHFGLGGPITLLLSLAVVDALASGPVSVAIDLKPALTLEQLEARIQRDLNESGKRHWKRIAEGLLPAKMVLPILERAGIDPDKQAGQATAAERQRLAGILKCLPFGVRGSLPLAAAIVTAGGVDLKEIDPRTLASKKVPGLYLCGEVMDLDADTGGYNLQAAFSTGFVAGRSAAAS